MKNNESTYHLYHLRDTEKSNGFGFGYDGYIGITDNLARRKAQHFKALKSGRHSNESLQKAYNKSPQSFRFYPITSGSKDVIEARERLLVPKNNHHLNKQKGGGVSRGMSKDEAMDKICASTGNKGGNFSSAPSVKPEIPQKENGTTVAGAGGVLTVLAEVGAGAGAVAVAVASGVGTAYALNTTLLKDDDLLNQEERDARKAGRIASYTGGGLGAASTLGAVCVAGEFGLGVAGVTSGLTAIGGSVATGAIIAIAAPAAIAAAFAGAVYGGYKLCKWIGS